MGQTANNKGALYEYRIYRTGDHGAAHGEEPYQGRIQADRV